MSYNMDFINQRADKVVVHDVIEGEDVEGVVIVKGGVEREVVSYTMTCPEPDCGGDGYYDELGEVVCEDCGCVISGSGKPVVPTEYNADADDSMGSSRGLEKMSNSPSGTREPSI